MRYPFEQEARHFASGVNHPGEVRGLFLSGRHVGITATEVRDGLMDELAKFAGGAAELFVDSGAFSEVEFGPDGPRVVAPITDADWQQRFDVYRQAAAIFRTRCHLVAPDRVGDQDVTMERLGRYAAHIQVCVVGARAQVIVPVQKGALHMGAFFRAACAVIGLGNLIAGVPMKKDATSLADLAELVGSMDGRSCRLHLLGIGPSSKKWRATLDTILAIRPDADITSDSVTLTAAQDAARARGLTSSYAIKSHAPVTQGFAELDADKARARALGWRDEESRGSRSRSRGRLIPEPWRAVARSRFAVPDIRLTNSIRTITTGA
jgi:hypothetical protein